MKIVSVKNLVIPEVKIITFQRSLDNRGYFTETYRKNEVETNPQTTFLKGVNFSQINESYSKKQVFRGFHFQWNPYMAKMLRVIKGNVIDFALDIRPYSETFGKIVGAELSSQENKEINEWIWIPVGFAHGIYFLEDSIIDYFCTGQWAPDSEQVISPYSSDIDWSLIDPQVKDKLSELLNKSAIISDKDKNGIKTVA